jgi:hypothetical protein
MTLRVEIVESFASYWVFAKEYLYYSQPELNLTGLKYSLGYF